MEGPLEPVEVFFAAGLRQTMREDRRPGVHWRVDVAKVPLVRGQLPARVQILLDQHQVQLLLAKVCVHQREREDVEGQVPRRIPGVFPLVWHRDDVGILHVMPLLVAGGVAPSGLERGGAPLLQPRVDIVVVELFRPEHPGEGLTQRSRVSKSIRWWRR